MRDHRSLKAWQAARDVTRSVLTLSRAHWLPHASALFTQMQRSSLSVQLNIAEGYALRTPAQFRRHLTIAYGSAVETEELLEIALDESILPREAGDATLATCRKSQRLPLGLLHRYRA